MGPQLTLYFSSTLLPFSILHFNNKILHSSSAGKKKTQESRNNKKSTGWFGTKKTGSWANF